MMLDRMPKPKEVIPVAAIAVGSGLFVMVITLMMLTRPPQAKARMGELTAKAGVVEATLRADGDLKAFPVGSVCTGQVDDSFKNRLNLALGNSGLAVTRLDINDAGTLGQVEPLNAYHLSLKATGTYENAIMALETLRRYRPKLFLDSLAIRNNTSSVEIDVEGRLFCR